MFNFCCCHGQLTPFPLAAWRPLTSLAAKRAKLKETILLPLETKKVARGNTITCHQNSVMPYSTDLHVLQWMHLLTNFLFWFLGVKSILSHYKCHQAENTNNNYSKQKRSTCFIQQLGREHTPNEQVIPLAKHQRTVSAEHQSLAKGDDVASLVERILQPAKNRVNWE